MDQVSASEIALQIPDLLATVLRCLGPLEWVKCAAVCPDWCDAILSRDEGNKAGGAAAAVSTMAPTPARRAAAATTAAVEGGAAMRGAEGGGEGKERVVTAGLWHEFALTLMAKSNEDMVEEGNHGTEVSNRGTGADNDGGCSFSHGEGDALFSCLDPNATGIIARGGQLTSSNHARGRFYRSVCLEGDHAVLGPPLTATAARVGNSTGRGEVEVATVSLRDVAAASLARYRQRRVLIKFMSLWTRHGGPTIPQKVQLEVTPNVLQLTLNAPLGRKEASRRGSSAKAAADRASSRSSTNGKERRESRGRPQKCCATTTALLHDALSVFTRLLVLCRRCRRPSTALFATEDSDRPRPRHRCPSPPTPQGSGTGHTSGKPTVAPGSPRCGRGGLALWVECHGEGCGVTSWVGVAAGNGCGCGGGGTDPPPWLAKFSRFVLNRAWKDINTLAEDHGTEWFSDTSPAAVQRRQDEARARSIGLDALASRSSASDGGDSSGGDAD